MKKNNITKLILLTFCICFLACGCQKDNDTKVTMKPISIYNNIAYSYVLSSPLSKAEGFAKDLAVVAKDEPGTDDNILSATAAILVDITDNTILFQKNPHMQLYPASTTKIMTGIVALKYGDFEKTYTLDDQVIITEDNAWLCDFRIGDQVTLEQVLYGAVVNSGNDAAAAVAAIVGGNQSSFASMMNKEAERIGATNTHFVNPHGLTDPNHYTTAYDLYLIFNDAIKNPDFLKICSTVEYSTTFTRKNYTIAPKWTNGCQFINGAVSAPKGVKVIGGKTGYTEAAGYCLVILSEGSNGHQYISVILNAPNKTALYNQMTYLLELVPQ